jgi:prepilin-type N-terminal cleavage/methylation domain-containing protein
MRRFEYLQRRRRKGRGFTLIELLVVMAIIGIMIGLLMPAISAAIVLSRKLATASLIESLSTGLENFKGDFTVYPPSDHNAPEYAGKSLPITGTDSQAYGYTVMMYCLCGPTGKGWGTGYQAQTNLPLSQLGGANKVFGPYYVPETSGSIANMPDAFRSPLRYIYYYRFDPKTQGNINGPVAGTYNVNDNPVGQGDSSNGFASQNSFNLLVGYMGVDTKGHWRRQDYVLISPGADRLYGYVKADGTLAYTVSDGTCDDVCNFPF